MSDRDNLAALVATINDTDALPVDARLDFLGDTAPAVSVQQLPGSRWTVRYIDGGGERDQPFAVLLRTGDTDTAGRLDATAALMALADALEELPAADLPAGVTGIEGLDTPVLVERSDNGSEVWRASYVLHSVRSA